MKSIRNCWTAINQLFSFLFRYLLRTAMHRIISESGPSYHHTGRAAPGSVDARLRDRVRRRGRLLPGVKRHRVRGQCGERASLDTTIGADHPAKHPRYKEPARDSQWSREHFRLDATDPRRGHDGLGYQGRESRNVSFPNTHQQSQLTLTTMLTLQ